MAFPEYEFDTSTRHQDAAEDVCDANLSLPEGFTEGRLSDHCRSCSTSIISVAIWRGNRCFDQHRQNALSLLTTKGAAGLRREQADPRDLDR